jgi:hypothetical protein
MNCSPVLTAQEFKTVHNALCDLDSVARLLEEVLRPELYIKLVKARDEIRKGLKSAYEQDNRAFESKSTHYQMTQEDLELSAIWSMYEVDRMTDRHPYAGADRVVYKDHWGEKPVSCSINGLSWSALYVAANACIRDSGDNHHVFIEDFIPMEDDPRTLYLITGS